MVFLVPFLSIFSNLIVFLFLAKKLLVKYLDIKQTWDHDWIKSPKLFLQMVPYVRLISKVFTVRLIPPPSTPPCLKVKPGLNTLLYGVVKLDYKRSEVS